MSIDEEAKNGAKWMMLCCLLIKRFAGVGNVVSLTRDEYQKMLQPPWHLLDVSPDPKIETNLNLSLVPKDESQENGESHESDPMPWWESPVTADRAWLIVRDDTPHETMYYDGIEFSTSVVDAVRFKRKEDGERMLKALHGNSAHNDKVESHIWTHGHTAEEPVLILLGRDSYSADVLYHFANLHEREGGAGHEAVARIRQCADEMRAYCKTLDETRH